MSSIAAKKFNWVPSPSAWDRAQAWRARQEEVRSQFEDAHSSASSAFANANVTQASGLAAIAANIASKRAQQQAIQRAFSKLV